MWRKFSKIYHWVWKGCCDLLRWELAENGLETNRHELSFSHEGQLQQDTYVEMFSQQLGRRIEGSEDMCEIQGLENCSVKEQIRQERSAAQTYAGEQHHPAGFRWRSCQGEPEVQQVKLPGECAHREIGSYFQVRGFC